MTVELNRAAPDVGAVELPALPKSKMLVGVHLDSLHVLYTADQMREYTRDAIDADRASRSKSPEIPDSCQAPGESVDTPEFRRLLAEWALSKQWALNNEKWATLIAHIDAYAARRAAGTAGVAVQERT